MKRDVYEGGIRAPLIARWPGTIRAGQFCDYPCAAWDLLPTAAEFAGVPPPPGIDGVSLVPSLGGRPQPQHAPFYWEYGHVCDEFKQAVRDGVWKGVRVGAKKPVEVYNLANDPAEANNANGVYRKLVAIAQVTKWGFQRYRCTEN